MNEFIEIFKEFDMNNTGMLLIACIALIGLAANYIQLIHASKVESVLMNKDEAIKRFIFLYVIMFFILCATTYLLTISAETWMLSVVIMVGIEVITFLFSFAKKECMKKIYSRLKEMKSFVITITATAVYTFIISVFFNASLKSCVILGALVAVLSVAISFLNVSNIRASITITIDNEKWYVFNRFDENYLLCGNKSNIEESKKTKLVSIEKIIEQDIYFNNDNIVD